MDSSDYQRRKNAFLDLFDRDPAARAARLTQIDDEDPALAADLRAQLDASGQSLPTLDCVASGVPPPRIAQYHLIRELGRGGMGRVWLAERHLGDAVQQVALKQIVHANWSEDDRRRFERERRILASLEHPHIAALVDGGSDAEGAPYLATVYIDGERLDRYARGHRLDLTARVQLVVKVAGAVAHAHRRLIVHRDLKPANILVDRDGAPKLLDFGVARLLCEEAITTTGPSQMTLRYAAPEQLRGDAESAGVASDIYALGVLLYELVADASPYPQTSDHSALLAAILQYEPAPPSARAVIAGCNADLDAIVLKALRKRAEDRYASAESFVADLQRWLRREPVDARRGERGYRTRAWLRRRWPWLAAACVVAGFLSYHFILLDRQVERIARERDKAQALAGYFSELFNTARPSDTERGDISARELLERSVAALRTDSDKPVGTRATLLLAAASALNYLGQVNLARDTDAEALRMLKAMDLPDPDLLAQAHSELASDLYKTGDLAGAQREGAAALALFERDEAVDTQRWLTVQQQVATYADEAGDRVAAQAAYERIVTLSLPLLQTYEGMRSYLAAQTNLATSEMQDNRTAVAETRLREALAVARTHEFEEPRQLLPMQTYLGRALYDQHKLDEGRVLLDQTHQKARDYYGANDPWLALILSHVAMQATLDGRPDLGAGLFDESLAITATSLDSDHPNVWARRSDRAMTSLVRADWSDAVRRLEQVLAWRERVGKSDAVNARFERAAIAYARCRQQPDESSRSRLRESLAGSEDWRGWKRWLAATWRGPCLGEVDVRP